MILILDGYNVAHQLPPIREALKQSLEKGREALENHLVNWKKLRNFSGPITIVYDGHQAASVKRHGIDCLFTRSREEADDQIIKMIRAHGNPGDAVVVSEDNKVSNSCRSLGARVEPASYLLLTKPARKSVKSFIENKNSASHNKITHDLKREWGIK